VTFCNTLIYICSVFYYSSSAGGETCCYDNDGNLIDIRDNENGGTVSRYHFRLQEDQSVPFFSYFDGDVLPYFHCCRNSDMCQSFIKLRPPATCDAYVPPTAGEKEKTNRLNQKF